MIIHLIRLAILIVAMNTLSGISYHNDSTSRADNI